MQQQRLAGVTVGSVEDLQAMANAITVHQNEAGGGPDSVDQAKQALLHMESGARLGKVAIADRLTATFVINCRCTTKTVHSKVCGPSGDGSIDGPSHPGVDAHGHNWQHEAYNLCSFPDASAAIRL